MPATRVNPNSDLTDSNKSKVISTAEVTNSAASSKCESAKLWKAAARAEERTTLLMKMKETGVGTARMEENYTSSKTRQTKDPKGAYRGDKLARNKTVIDIQMKDAIRGALKEEKAIRKKRDKARADLETKLGKNSSKYRSLIKNLKKLAQKEKAKLKIKNKQKVEHLQKKYIHKKILQQQTLQPNLKRYENAKIFSTTNTKEDTFKPSKPGKVVKIGEVKLSEDEEALLLMCPDFATFSTLSEELHNVEILAAGVKHRWEDLNTEEDPESDNPEEDKRILETMKRIEAQARMVYNPTDNEINLGNQRATDCPGNTRVYLPKPMTAIKEAMLSVRSSEWKKPTSPRTQMKEESRRATLHHNSRGA